MNSEGRQFAPSTNEVPKNLWGDLENNLSALQDYVQKHPEDTETYQLAYSPRPDRNADAIKLLQTVKEAMERLGLNK